MIGRNHKGAIMTTNDRCTHLVLIRRLAGKEATQLASKAIEALLPYKDKIYTITADNGKEFARHKEIAKGLDAEFDVARPYHSWERGANENIFVSAYHGFAQLGHEHVPFFVTFSQYSM